MRWIRPLGSSAVLLPLLAVAAAAFVPANQNERYEILLPEYPVATERVAVDLASQLEVERATRTALGGAWKVHHWNPHTRTASDVVGSGAVVGPALTTDATAESTARRVIDDLPEVFKTPSRELRLDAVTRGRGKVAVHFVQQYRGIDVLRTQVYTTFMEDTGRLFVMGSDAHVGIDLDPIPALSAAAATTIARDAVPFDPATDRVEGEAELFVLPVPTSARDVEHHLVWRVRVRTESPLGAWVTHVDAHDGEIVYRYNDIHFLDYTGSVDDDNQPISYCYEDVNDATSYMTVKIDGEGAGETDVDGNFVLANPDELEHEISAELVGPYVDVVNSAGPSASFSTLAAPGDPITISWDDSNSQADERDVFDGVNDIHDFFQVVDPFFTYPTFTMQATVSIPQNCNAFWDGSINFYSEGGGCANTGEIQGVVQHEFGHGVQWALIGGQGNEGLGEGNSDVLANLLTQESIIARGFSLGNCSSGIRNSDNNLRYPQDVVGHGVHAAGRVIAGVHWDLMVALQDRDGEEAGTALAASLWHFARKVSRPQFQPDQVLAIFVADDDDGDLTNGTPNYIEICDAAAHHGFDCTAAPGVHFVGGEAWNLTESVPQTIATRPFSTEGDIVPSSLTLNWRTGGSGSFTTVPLDPTGVPEQYEATIPAYPRGTVVEYYLEGDDDAGSTGTAPEGAPGELFTYVVASHFDPFEEESGWTVGLPDDDATNGIWERIEPVGTQAQAYLDHTPSPGELCWFTGQHQGVEGGTQGQSDVDDGKTTLLSPVYDLSPSTEFAVLQYRRWHTNDTRFFPDEDPFVVRISNDAGETWVEVERDSTSDRSWRLVEHDLMALFGGSVGEVQVMFESSDYDADAVVESGVDDFTIIADMGETTVAVEPGSAVAPSAAYLSAARPNPFTPRTTIRFGLTRGGPVELLVYDVQGRKVRGLVNGSLGAGHHGVVWDGRDDAGRTLESGVYYTRLVAEGTTTTRSVTLLR